MSPDDPKNWSFIIHESAYTRDAVIRIFGIARSCLRRWELDVKPNKKNLKKMTDAMKIVQQTPRLKKHQSFGYCTPEQIDILRGGGLSPERDAVLQQVKKQTELEGKTIL